jgi:predicted ATPase/class 3 adenylate cyclase
VTNPSGTVTFLFSDIEGSTQRWERDPDAMSAALARHDALLRDAIEAHEGYVFKVMGDSFCAAFATAPSALAAALCGQRSLLAEDFSSVDGIRVRMAVHSGPAEERNGDYLGPAVNRVARLLSIGHGGQVLVSAAAAELLDETTPPGSSLRDLGAHRLKDLTRSERVYQLVAPDLIDTFPALRSFEHLPNNLPLQLTSFVGRDEQLAELKTLTRQHRLVTLVGTGGAGKTRCAIQAGAELLEEFSDGVWLVELAPISDSSLIATAIAQALKVREEPNRPLLDTLLAHLERRQMLLIVDNCEHLIDEARNVIAAILRGAPRVRVLATSRESLNVGGERALQLPSLSASDSVTLFADRARAADSRFELSETNAPFVSEIAERLDGIPLAIELAAARVKVLSPQQLAQKLDERLRILTGGDRSALPRHRTMRALIDWSYDLLDERERALFRRLAIFAGGWTLQSATEICSGDGIDDEWEMLDALSSLVDKSLVIVDAVGEDRRYRMLNSIREYARERLGEAGEIERIAEKHARFYAEFVHGLEPLVEALEDVEWRQTLAVELDNIRGAVEWTIFGGHDIAIGLALLADMEWPQLLTEPHESLRWFETAGRFVDAMPSALAHARILRHCVLLERIAGRTVAECEETARRAVEVAKATRDTNEIARALANLGGMCRDAVRFDEADRAFTEAFKTPALLSRATTTVVLRMWAVMNLQRGEIELAHGRVSEVARLERPGSEAHASALLNLGELHFAAGDIQAAREAAIAAKETYADMSSVYLVLVLSNIAAYAMAADDVAEARNALREALHLQQTLRSVWLSTVLEHHALLTALEGEHDRAVLLVGFTDRRYVSLGDARQRTEQRGYERLMRLLAQSYSGDDLARRMGEGAGLTEEQALAVAAAIHEATPTHR